MKKIDFIPKITAFVIGMTYFAFQAHALYVELDTNNFKYIDLNLKHEHLPNFNLFSRDAIIVKSALTYEEFNNELADFANLREIEDLFESVKGAAEYKRILDQLKQLPCASPAALIDPSWLIGATHVLIDDIKRKTHKNEKGEEVPDVDVNGDYIAADNAIEFPNQGIPQNISHFFGEENAVFVDKIFYHPNLDLALAHYNKPLLTIARPTLEGYEPDENHMDVIKEYSVQSIKRFRGTYNNQPIYAYSDTIHNFKGDVVEGDLHPALAKCEIEGEVTPETAAVKMKIVGPKPFTIRSYGGDSSGPIFVQVSQTNDPHKDFELIGINAPDITHINSIYLPHKEINTWVDNVILAVALGSDPSAGPHRFARKLAMPGH